MSHDSRDIRTKLDTCVTSIKESLSVLSPLVVNLSKQKENKDLKMNQEYGLILGLLSDEKTIKGFVETDYSSAETKADDLTTILELSSAATRLLAALYLDNDAERVSFYLLFFNF